MISDYSAFDINQILSELEKRNVSISFEKIDQLYEAFEDIFPILLNAKARSKKYFTALINETCYDSDSFEIKKTSKYNPYSDAGVVFDENDRTNIQHLTQFLQSYRSLENTYFFEASNTFGTTFTSDMKYILHSEYNLNYVSLHTFDNNELEKFINYMPKFLESCPEKMEDIKSYDIGMASVTVNPDHTPKKFNFFISKKNFCELNIDYEDKEKIQTIINSECFTPIIKVGFYFIGPEQYKWSVVLGMDKMKEISEELIINDELKKYIKNSERSTFIYEMVWDDKILQEKNILCQEA